MNSLGSGRPRHGTIDVTEAEPARGDRDAKPRGADRTQMAETDGSTTKRDAIETKPGWATIIALAQHKSGAGEYIREQRREVRAHVVAGRLVLEADNPPEDTRGVLAAATALAAETCDACGAKGDPIADGCKCRRCREPGTVILARPWNPGEVEDHPDAQSPGQWTQDIRGGSTGNAWDHTNWRHYRRLETAYGEQIGALMTALDAADDALAILLWPGGGGWAGLLRALFLTLHNEQDDRAGVQGHVPWAAALDEGEVRTPRHPDYREHKIPVGSDEAHRGHERVGLYRLREARPAAVRTLVPAAVRPMLEHRRHD